MPGRFGYQDFAILRITDLGNEIIHLVAHTLDNRLFKLLILTDFEIILHAKKHILSSPEIPAVKLMTDCIAADSSQLILRAQKILHRSGQHFVKLRVVGIRVHKAGSPHHFPPVFTSPTGIIIGIFFKLLNKPFP